MSPLEVRPVTAERWPDLVKLFERRGPRGGSRNVPAYGCWCMYWRNRGLAHGEAKKRALGRLAKSGSPPGLLAYDGAEPVGWISAAPREDYRALLSSPQYRPRDEDAGVWSIVCFVVDKPRQGEGIPAVLLDAAVEHARKSGASAIEAYPHRFKADDYMGSINLFREHGFRPVRETGKREVVRRAC